MIAERAHQDTMPEICCRMLSGADEDGSRMDDRQLRDEALTLFWPLRNYRESVGMDLVVAGYSSPRRREEVAPRAGHGACRASALHEDLPNLRYAAIFLTESLRMYPPPGHGAPGHRRSRNRRYPVPAGRASDAQWWFTAIRDGLKPPTQFLRSMGSDCRAAASLRPIFHSRGPRQCIGNMFALMRPRCAGHGAKRFRLRMTPGVRLCRWLLSPCGLKMGFPCGWKCAVTSRRTYRLCGSLRWSLGIRTSRDRDTQLARSASRA